MLYELHERNRAIMAPMAKFAHALSLLFTNPVSQLAHTPFAQRAGAGFELLYRLGKDYEKPSFNIASACVAGRDIAIEMETVLAKPFCNLLHFKKAGALSHPQPKVLLVAPLSGHHATLLRDTANTLLPEHDVYITDWLDARTIPLDAGAFGLDDYVRYVQEFIRALAPDLHVISVCQPTVPVLAAISLMATANDPALPKSMTMMGGPIDARKSPTKVDDLATEKDYSWFENSVIYTVPANYPGHGRKVYPGFLQHYGFISMNAGRHAKSYREFYEHLATNGGDDVATAHHRKFYDEYNAVLDMPADFYLDTIKIVFQEHRLPLGTWEVAGKLVRPQDIKGVALLTVEGELDDITGEGQTRAAHELCTSIPTSKRQHLVVPKTGHFGIFSGRRWQEEVYPRVADFISASA